MKVRFKFSKYGVMKYIGHLDIMRYFQKCMRRAEIDIAYSTGFSPHQIMSFAAPLGVGIESFGEYFDAQINSGSSKDILERLNAVMVKGMEITSVKALPDDAVNAMASIAAASYLIKCKDKDNNINDYISNDDIAALLNRDSIIIIKQTKKQEMEFDIRPHIYEIEKGDDYIKMLVDASSAGNLKPLVVIEQLFKSNNMNIDERDFSVIRLDMFTRMGNELISLGDLGSEF